MAMPVHSLPLSVAAEGHSTVPETQWGIEPVTTPVDNTIIAERAGHPSQQGKKSGAKILIVKSLEERSRKRLETMETHRTQSFVDAEAWDLDFWQRRTPDERLSALVAIHRDVAAVEAVKAEATAPGS